MLTYTGDVTTNGNTNLDAVAMHDGSLSSAYSEIVVSSQDTRSLSVATLTPNAAGDQNQWTGAYTDIDENGINDADLLLTTTADNNFLCHLTNTPSGSFSVKAVKVAARSITDGSGIGSLSVGVKTNSADNTPAAESLSTLWTTKETFYMTNPVTLIDWTTTDLNNLQIKLKSGN